MALEFYDRASFASVALAGDLAAADEARLKAMLTDFLAAVCRATGQVLFEEGHFATADARLGTEAFLVRWDGPIREARRRNARVRHRQRLGWPNVAFLTLVALGFAGLIVWDAVRWATAIA